MEADFAGYATKAGLKCTDGRVIMPNAFEHQDKQRVPLVWQHGHNDVQNVLGYAILEHREDGVYAYGFFNDSPAGQAARTLVQHGDIESLSIWANGLVEKSKQVFHGSIKELSLVLSGANPGAKIDPVTIRHSDDPNDVTILEDEAVIYTGLHLEHTDTEEQPEVQPQEPAEEPAPQEPSEPQPETPVEPPAPENDPVEGVDPNATVQHADDNETVQDVYNAFTPKQKDVVHFMIGAALEQASADNAEHSDQTGDHLNHQEGTEPMNVFEQNGTKADGPTLSHDDLKSIVENAQKIGSFKEAFIAHAATYGIEDIDVLFPDARSLTPTPELISRRMEWVSDVINGTKHSPFSRVKSTAADLTADEARAKGYVKGAKKKEEIIKLLKRVTTPKTVYKKQKLDRDDIIDITDLDVVAWLKAEMRLMLDEEIARAVLVGDGREADDEDKIDEDHLRPIAYDDDMYSHKVTVPSNIEPKAIVEAVLRARTYYRGTGTPTMYTTDEILTDLMLQEDKMGRRLYETEAALAAAMRVNKIVTVEVMQDTPDLLCVIVNLADYTIGADRGGNVSMFDDFDIDYNQYKYLIETRISGALTRPKSALVIRREVGTSTTPVTPSYNGTTHTLTIPDIDGVTYKIDGVTQTPGDQVINETTEVEAFADAGYSFPHNTVTDWTYVYTP